MKADYVPKVGDKLKLAIEFDLDRCNDPVSVDEGELKVGNVYCVEKAYNRGNGRYSLDLVGIKLTVFWRGKWRPMRIGLGFFCFPSETISAQ